MIDAKEGPLTFEGPHRVKYELNQIICHWENASGNDKHKTSNGTGISAKIGREI